MIIPDQVKRLIAEELQREDLALPPGASEAEIAGFEARTGVRMPEELRALYRWSNGPPVGPSGIYRLDSHGRRGIELDYQFCPGWRQRGWIPIAGDGCGSTYLLDTRMLVGGDPGQSALPSLEPLPAGTHPVYFKDHETDPDDLPGYVVASGLWAFLRFWLLDGRWDVDWPFDRAQVLEHDPALEGYRGIVPLPWNAGEETSRPVE